MADQVEEYGVNNTILLENGFYLKSEKDEEYQHDDFSDDKVHISETGIIRGNTELQDHLLFDKMKQPNIWSSSENIKTKLSSPKDQSEMIHSDIKIEEGISTEDIKVEFNKGLISFPEVQHDNLKIKDEIGMFDIRIEFNNGLLYCEDCQVYYEQYCTQCGMLVHILNRTPINDDKSRKELPGDDILEIQDYFGKFHIVALKVIPVDVKFGPFVGLNRTEYHWKIKSGKFVVNRDKLNNLNWMQYINPARNISEQNLLIFQCEHNLYYQSTREIQAGDELLVYFGEEYEDSLDSNVEMDFIPTTKHISKDAFACTICCLGFSSKSYLVKHKTVCPGNTVGEFSVEELMQCLSCKIHLDQKEYTWHRAYCCERNDRKCMLQTLGGRASQLKRRKTRPRLFYNCQQCRYRTKYKGDLKNHTNQHYETKMFKCGTCYRRFKTKEFLTLHVENTHNRACGKKDSERPIGDHMKAKHLKEFKYKCESCNYTTNRKSNLKTHMETTHSKEHKYKCDTCAYVTNVKYNLNLHTKTIHMKEFMGDYKVNRKYYLRTHVETKHLVEFKYECDKCDYKANWKCHLRAHIETKHLKEINYKCEMCNYATYWKGNLKIHIEARHLKKLKKKYKCDTCSFTTHAKSMLKTHIDGKHLKELNYKCNMCDFKANWRTTLKKHIDTRHLREFKYKCDTCDYKSNWKSDLKSHIKTRHLREFKYKCDRCDYKANLKSTLKAHLEARHSSVLQYKCDTCRYETSVKYNLKRHVKMTHLKEFLYKCDMCDYKTNLKSALKAHSEATHSSEFKYKCDRCDYKTNRKHSLNIHIEAKHLNEFKYKCDRCEYKANLKTNLTKHMEARHSSVFKYKCVTCNYETNRKHSLKEHLDHVSHLKELKYNCNICDYKASQKAALTKHIRARHSTERLTHQQLMDRAVFPRAPY